MSGPSIPILQRFCLLAGAVLAVSGPGVERCGAATDIWMVRTYRFGTAQTCPVGAGGFDYLRFDARGAWTWSSQAAFLATHDPYRPTVVFAHGGFTDDAWATHLTVGLARSLCGYSGGQPVRIVLWKWPSERSFRRLRPDLRAKAARADFEGLLLARWLRQFDPHAPVTLVGYSAGGRVIASGLNRYAAESAAFGQPPGSASFRAVLVAPALDADDLLPGRRAGMAIDAVETMLVTHHRRDRALRFYPHLYPRYRPRAMGFVGVACPWMLSQRGGQLQVMDLTTCIAGRHDFLNYLSAPPLAARLVDLVFTGTVWSDQWQQPPLSPLPPVGREMPARHTAQLPDAPSGVVRL